MKYRRPRDYDTVVSSLRALTGFEVCGPRKRLQRAVERLFEIDWFEAAMKPLYSANVTVQMLVNSLVPAIQELILEDRALEELAEATNAAKATKCRGEFGRMRARLVNAARTRERRGVTPDFERMAAAMEAYVLDDEIQCALCELFSLTKAARTALRFIYRRIEEALVTQSGSISSVAAVDFSPLSSTV